LPDSSAFQSPFFCFNFAPPPPPLRPSSRLRPLSKILQVAPHAYISFSSLPRTSPISHFSPPPPAFFHSVSTVQRSFVVCRNVRADPRLFLFPPGLPFFSDVPCLSTSPERFSRNRPPSCFAICVRSPFSSSQRVESHLFPPHLAFPFGSMETSPLYQQPLQTLSKPPWAGFFSVLLFTPNDGQAWSQFRLLRSFPKSSPPA